MSKIPENIGELITILQNHQCRVVFTKKDNSLRIMYCTLKEEKLPPRELNRSASVKQRKNANVIPVWDLHHNAWRSFRFNTIQDFTIQEDLDGI